MVRNINKKCSNFSENVKAYPRVVIVINDSQNPSYAPYILLLRVISVSSGTLSASDCS